jgi:hypothetical protein
VPSSTVTLNVHAVLFNAVSRAVQVTVVTPSGYGTLEGGRQMTFTDEQLSVAVAGT